MIYGKRGTSFSDAFVSRRLPGFGKAFFMEFFSKGSGQNEQGKASTGLE